MRPAARIREDLGLLGKTVGREIAGEQDEICVLRDRRERAREPLTQRLGGMDVARRRDPNRRIHGA